MACRLNSRKACLRGARKRIRDAKDYAAEDYFKLGKTENVGSINQVAEAESQIERTVLRIRELILTGEFGPGQRISEHPLTVRLGVSRTPIRLALERLALLSGEC